jgi:hypothetical protein
MREAAKSPAAKLWVRRSGWWLRRSEPCMRLLLLPRCGAAAGLL